MMAYRRTDEPLVLQCAGYRPAGAATSHNARREARLERLPQNPDANRSLRTIGDDGLPVSDNLCGRGTTEGAGTNRRQDNGKHGCQQQSSHEMEIDQMLPGKGLDYIGPFAARPAAAIGRRQQE